MKEFTKALGRSNLGALVSKSVLLEVDLLESGAGPWVGHIPFAFWIIEQLQPRIFVELGTYYGQSYFSFCQSVRVNGLFTKCYAVDTWQGDEHSGFYGEEVFAYVEARNQRLYHAFSRLLRMRFDDALSYFSDGTVDLLHIDGLHTYEAVQHDFETWLPKLSSRGVVLFHDINVRERGFGVWRLWEELSTRYPHIEFEHSHGLGVLFVGDIQPSGITELLEEWSTPEGRSLIKHFFAKLGHLVSLEYQAHGHSQVIAERDNLIAALAASVTEQEGRIGSLEETVREKAAQVSSLNQTLAEREGQISNLNQTVSEGYTQLILLNQGVAERDEQISQLREQETRLQGQVAELLSSAQEAAAQIASLSQTIDEREEQLIALNQGIAKRDSQLANLNQAVAEHQEQLTTISHTLAERDGQIISLSQTVAEREAQIISFNQGIAEQDSQIVALDASVKEQAGRIGSLEEIVREKDSQIISLSQTVAERDGQISSLNQAIAEREGRIAAILSSRSWRLTRPMRWLGDQLRRLRRWFRFSLRTILFAPKRFDAEWYLKQNPDVAKSGMDPYKHYILFGKAEGRQPAPDVPMLHSNKSSVYHLLRITPQIIAQKGGIWRTCAAVLRVYRREGFAGIKCRIKQFRAGSQPNLYGIAEQISNVNQAVAVAGRDEQIVALDASVKEKEDRGRRLEVTVASRGESLPSDFNPSVYLELNPDVRLAGVDPGSHYLQHGYLEDRQYAYPKLVRLRPDTLSGKQAPLLVVCHEASRTGAPILGLNLVQQLSATNDVVALLLGKGPLLDDFVQAAAGAWLCADLRFFASGVAAMAVVDELCSQYAFSAAIVNSVECRSVLPALHRRGVPTILLLHEFAAYTRPLNAFPRALFWSERVVFSARVARDDALRRLELRDATHLTILPQGKCISAGLGAAGVPAAQLPMSAVPGGAKSVCVLGVGAVQYRKGVDLFIECARKMRVSDPSIAYHFYWVGSGYQPTNDLSYSAYLADQIQRAGITRHFTILGETDQLELIYSQADLFLLTSRLDPLPNVGIDAAVQGLPLLCFTETTGIADFLVGIRLGEHLVADYLDTTDMAAKATALARSPDLRKTVSATLRTRATEMFSMPAYVASLRGMLNEVVASRRREAADVAEIQGAGVLRADFCVHPAHAELCEHLDCDEGIARAYVRAWATGLYRRKPFPGFHPAVYAELNAIAGTDPLAHYLRSGRPAGPWQWQVLTPNDPVAREDVLRDVRVALHIHGHYVELIDQMLLRLAGNTIRPDLFITLTNESQRLEVWEKMRDYSGRVVRLEVVPNRGRDVGAFLSMMAGNTLAGYDLVGHLHTKKSADVSDASVGRSWYVFLLENLLGGDVGPMLDRIVTAMMAPVGPEMIYPDDPYVFGDESNRTILEHLAARAGWPTPPRYHGFPVGSMFWARPAVLQPLFRLGLGPEDWPAEPLPYDGTLLHALERAFGLATWGRPGAFATTNVLGVTR